jgi:DNA-binding MarR family transcriptional regulator
MGPGASNSSADPAAGLAFLISQLGSHVSALFAEGLAPLKLTPPHTGILSAMTQFDGLSQQALGEKLGVFPSRLVQLLDELEERGLVERRDNPADRRSYALYLTDAGRQAVNDIQGIAHALQNAVCGALDKSQQIQLKELLTRIATEQKLAPGVHPGLRRRFGPGPAKEC